MPRKDPKPKYNYKELYPNAYNLAESLTTYVPAYNKYTPENFMDMLQLISNAETGNKNIAQMGGGPGRGFYQMEKNSSKVARNRAANISNDLINLGYKQGIKLPEFNEDFTKLSKDDQAVYVLSNMVKAASSKRATDPNAYVNPLDPKGSWVQYHWAGKEKDRPAREKHWDEVNTNANDILNNFYNQEYSIYSKEHGLKGTGQPVNIISAPKIIDGTLNNTFRGNWVDTFDDGGDVPSNKKGATIYTTNTPGSYFDPVEGSIYLNKADANNPSVLPHEMEHYNQWLRGDLRYKPGDFAPEDEAYMPADLSPYLPLKVPSIVQKNSFRNEMPYYNRRAIEQDILQNNFLSGNPSFNFVNPELIYNKAVNPEMYETPWTAEGEAEQVGNQYIGPYKQGGLIKRADGSYSRRGLWDNIRANKGSGRKPTAAMLEQERKIKKHDDGGWIDMYNAGSWVTNSSIPTPTTPSFYDAYPDRTLTNYQMGTDKAPMYKNGGPIGGGNNPIYVTDPNDPRLKAYNDSLSLYNNYINLKNVITKGGKYYPGFESSKPLNKTKTDQFTIPNPNNPITYRQIHPTFGFNVIGKTGLPDITIVQKKNIQPISTQTFTRKESKYKSEAEYDKAAKQIKDFNEKAGQANWIGYEIQEYKEPVQPVNLKKEEELKKVEPIKPKLDFSVDEELQPIVPTPYTPDPVRRVMNPAFDFNIDFIPNRTKEAVVDQAGNPRYKYYNQDKVISEQEYNQLMQKKANGGPIMYGNGGFTKGEDLPIDPHTGKPVVFNLPEIKIIAKRNSPIDSTNVRESTAVNTPKINDPIITNPFDENWLNPDYAASVANQLLKEHNVKVDSTSNMLRAMGLPSSAYYNPITRTINYNSNADNSEIAKRKYFRNVVAEIPHAIQADRMGAVPFLVNIGIDALSNPNYSRYRQIGTLENEAHRIIEPQLEEKIEKAASIYPSIHKQGGPGMYREGATVFTKQTTPTWAAGSTTPTTTQNFRNDRSLNTSRYRIGDVVPIPESLHAFDPSAGTHDYNKDIQPPKKMVLHAPDTLRMKDGSHVTNDYKKRVGIPYAISPGVSNAGMYVGPTTQRGITFADGGYVKNNNSNTWLDTYN